MKGKLIVKDPKVSGLGLTYYKKLSWHLRKGTERYDGKHSHDLGYLGLIQTRDPVHAK
jgi:hypothetical protein